MGKILSVDDSNIMRKIIQGAIEVLGYGFLEAVNGKKALDVLEVHCNDINLIVMDVNMPEMDGFTALEIIKSDDRFKSIPVMMVTTESERERVVRAIRLGAANYVCKPFSQEDLMTKMLDSMGLGLGF